jgi:DNA-binding NarL/FixJ family response regulator
VIRLLIVERTRWMGEAMVSALKDEVDISVVRIATEESEVLASLPQCNMLLISGLLPDGNVLNVLKSAHDVAPGLPVIVLDLSDSTAPATYFRAAGAAATLGDQESLSELIGRMRSLHIGSTPGAGIPILLGTTSGASV